MRIGQKYDLKKYDLLLSSLAGVWHGLDAARQRAVDRIRVHGLKAEFAVKCGRLVRERVVVHDSAVGQMINIHMRQSSVIGRRR